MSRDEKVAVVESFLGCIVSGKLEGLPVAPDLTVQSPLTAKLSGAAAMEYVKAVAAGTQSIEIVQHIVEGDHVATLTENQTINGPLSVFAKFEIESGRIKNARVFYDVRRITGST